MDLNTETLESLCELVVDCPHSTPKWTDSGIIVLRNQNIKNGVLDLSNPSFTNEEDYQKRVKRAIPRAGDIVITREAPMGEVCIIPEGLKCCLGQRQVLLRPRNEICGEYFFWALQSPYVQDQISWNEGTGTTVSNVRIPVLKALMIPRLPKHEKQSAKILSVLASKLEVNQKTNQTLEQMAQALFKSWFVDFDPVFDNLLASVDFKLENLETSLPDELKQKAQRRLAALNSLENVAQYKASLIALAHELQALSQTKEATKEATQAAVQVSEKATETPVKANFSANPNILAQHANTHAHFPNEFEHNEQLGWIPKGWCVDNLSIIAKFTSERINGDDLTFDNYISTDNMCVNRGGITKASKLPEVKTTPGFHSGHILISNIRPYFKKIWLATSSGGRSNDVLGFEALEPKNTGYLFNLLFQDVFFDYMMTTSKGSKMPRGDKKAIMDWMIVIPPINLQEKYSMLVKEFHKAISLKNKEIDTLTELRDTLLPKLISGELQIPDAATVEEIVD
jgi:type I restriction enzyme S subunit